MAELVEILRAPGPRTWPFVVETQPTHNTARLIPGCARNRLFSERTMDRWSKFVDRALPGGMRSFDPGMLTTAALDLFAISIMFQVASGYLPGGSSAPLYFFYIAMFLILAINDGLYQSPTLDGRSARSCAAKTVAWTTILCSLPVVTWQKRPISSVVLWSALNVLLLVTMRRKPRSRQPSDATRNTLLVIDHHSGGKTDIAAGLSPRRMVSHILSVETAGPALGTSIRRVVREKFVDEILVCTQDQRVFDITLREARSSQVDLYVVPQLFGSTTAGFARTSGLPVIAVREHASPDWSLALKRLIDLGLASVACLTLSPLLITLALSVWLDSRGPILYRSSRVGRSGRKFTCYKFRTMVPEADRLKEQLRDKNERRGAFFKITDDPRVTRVGRVLRKYSLDELPQLWNVLRGEMSLVGPRPHPPDDVQRYRPEHLQRLDFVPGITGLWQITARRDPSFDRSVALDVEYIKNWSLALDLRILLRTLPSVIQGSGT